MTSEPDETPGGRPSLSSQILPALPPPDARAAALYRGVDEAYFGFVDRLPEGLRSLGRSQTAFSGRDHPGDFAGPSSLNPDFAATTFLFWSACRGLPDDNLAAIARSSGLLGAAAVLLDHIADEQQEDPVGAQQLQSALVDEARRLLHGVFENVSPFWQQLERIWAELTAAFEAESLFRLPTGSMTLEAFQQIAGIKAAPLIVAVAAVAQLTGRAELLAQGEASLKFASAASQLAHDVLHWKRDAENHHATCFISMSLGEDRAESGPSLRSAVAEGVRRDQLDVQCLRLALEWLDSGIDLVVTLDCPEWPAYLRAVRAFMEQLLLRHVAHYVLRRPPGATAT